MLARLAILIFAAAITTAVAAAGDYDKTWKTDAYELRLRVPAAALAIAPLKAEIMRRWNASSAEIKEQAISDKKEMPQYFHPYMLDTNWRLTYASADIVSISADSFIDQGGAHPNGEYDSIVWDKAANKPVALADLFAPGQLKPALAAIAASARKTWIATVNKESGSDPVDPAMAEEGIGADVKTLGHYALTYAKGQTKANGIVLLYGAGEQWAHVMGEFRLAVPVSVFRKYLAPRWQAELN